MAEPLATIQVETAGAPSYAIVWMHGLGAQASDFRSVPKALGLQDGPGVRFIFPQAPSIPVTCNGGMVMAAWYDIISASRNARKINEDGLLQSREAIRRLIARENERGIPCRQVFLAGFSQGGAMAYATGLTHPEPLAGIIALSTYLPSSPTMIQELSAANRDVPIFCAHGSEDEVVAPEMGEQARDTLIERGYRPKWQVFPMAHSVSIGEIRAVGAWLRQQLAQ